MGIEDRDWYRRDEARRRGGDGGISGATIVVVLVLGLAVAGVAKRMLDGPPPTYAVPPQTHRLGTSVVPGIPLGGDAVYPRDDPWLAYLADERACPGGERLDAPLTEQATTLACLIDFARARHGLRPLRRVAVLDHSSVLKAGRIRDCRDFDHDACGAAADTDARKAGHRGAWGENLYIAGGPLGSPRVALDRWLNSPGHRENILRPDWRTQGIAVRKLARFGHDRSMTLWVNQFGT